MLIFTFLDSLIVIRRMAKKANVKFSLFELSMALAHAKTCEALANLTKERARWHKVTEDTL